MKNRKFLQYALVTVLVLGAAQTVRAAVNYGLSNYDCVAGQNANANTTTGNENISCGSGSLQALTTGDFNVAYGVKTGRGVTTGSSNTAIGYAALSETTTGASNTGVGRQAGSAITTGSNNTVMGFSVGSVTMATGTGNVLIGTSASCDTDAAGTNNQLKVCSGAIPAITGNVVTNGVLGFLGNTRVTTDFSSASATLAAVTGLTSTLESGKNYTFRAVLYFDADATGGHKYAMAGTATASSVIYHVTSTCDASGLSVITARATALAAASSQAGCTAGKTVIEGTLTTSAAGTILPQFAQSTASGTSAIKAGSTFHVELLP